MIVARKRMLKWLDAAVGTMAKTKKGSLELIFVALSALMLSSCLPSSPPMRTNQASSIESYQGIYSNQALLLQSIEGSTHYIQIGFGAEHGFCSATAIGPHALLTAQHCFTESGYSQLSIDGKKVNVNGAPILDGNDHVILIVSRTFSSYVSSDTALPLTGAAVYNMGAPGQFSKLFRTGTVAGYSVQSGNEVITLYNMGIWFGDSGSAIFNAQGSIVGVVSAVFSDTSRGAPLTFGISFPLHFTSAQWAMATRVVHVQPLAPKASIGPYTVPKVNNTLPSGPLSFPMPSWCQTGAYFFQIHIVDSVPDDAQPNAEGTFYITLGPNPDRMDLYVNVKAYSQLPNKLKAFLRDHPNGGSWTQESCPSK